MYGPVRTLVYAGQGATACLCELSLASEGLPRGNLHYALLRERVHGVAEGGTAVKEVVDVHDVCHVETGRIGDVKGPPLRRSFACQ